MSSSSAKGPRTWAEFLGKPPDMMKLVLVATAAGIVFMTVPGLFGLKPKSPPEGATPVMAQTRDGKETEIELQQERMSRELERILSRIEGAGRVHVDVQLATGVTSVPVINISEQKTTTGEKAADDSQRNQETTTVNKTNVVVENALAVSQQLRPEIAGVMVVADGAASDRMRYRLTKAVADHLRIPLHMVRVEASDKGRS